MTTITHKLFQSRNVILDMIKSRGFQTNPYKNYSRNEIDIMFRNMPTKANSEESPLDIEVKNSKSNKLIVKYVINLKLRTAFLITLVDDIITTLNEDDTLIIIVKDKINNIEPLENILESYYDKYNIFVQIFWIDKLQINITQHSLVPKHEIINDIEKNKILKEWNLTSFNQLPVILSKDPVAKYIGMKKGNICKITRSSETAGIYHSYRYCQ